MIGITRSNTSKITTLSVIGPQAVPPPFRWEHRAPRTPFAGPLAFLFFIAMPTLSAPLPSTRPRDPLIEALELGLQNTRTAGIADIVQLVQMLSNDSSDVSVHQLADLIEKDVVVSTKVISAANKLGYNTHGVDIESIPQAVQQVGLAKIRSLAVSLTLLENAEHIAIQEPRQNTMISLCAGMLSRVWARTNERAEPDRHFLCGSLRNLGALLLSSLRLEDYRRVQSRIAEGQAPSAVYAEVFGRSPAEITHVLLSRAGLAHSVLSSLCPLPPDLAQRRKLAEHEEIQVVTDFFVRFCAIALDAEVKPTAYQAAVQKLIHEYPYLHLSSATLDPMLELVEQGLRAYGDSINLRGVAGQISKLLSSRRRQLRAPEVREEAPPAATAGAAKSAPVACRPLPVCLEEATNAVSDELTRPFVRFEQAHRLVKDALTEGWQAQSIEIFIAVGSSFRPMTPVDLLQAPGQRPAAFRADEASLLGLCSSRGEPILIHDALEPKLAPLLPRWFKSPQVRSCLFFPNGPKGQVSALVCIAWTEARKVEIGPEDSRRQRSLLGLLVAAQRLAAQQ
jgi:HD-like signal output (HDOD) protein